MRRRRVAGRPGRRPPRAAPGARRAAACPSPLSSKKVLTARSAGQSDAVRRPSRNPSVNRRVPIVGGGRRRGSGTGPPMENVWPGMRPASMSETTAPSKGGWNSCSPVMAGEEQVRDEVHAVVELDPVGRGASDAVAVAAVEAGQQGGQVIDDDGLYLGWRERLARNRGHVVVQQQRSVRCLDGAEEFRHRDHPRGRPWPSRRDPAPR